MKTSPKNETSRLNTRISKPTMRKLFRGMDLVKKGKGLKPKGKSDTGDKVPRRANLVMKRLQEQLENSDIEDAPTICVEKNMIVFRDCKEQVYMYRFGSSYVSPIDGKIKYITQTIGKEEKQHVLNCRVLKTMDPYEDLRFIRSCTIPIIEEMIIVHGWRKKEMGTLFDQRSTYMRTIKYPSVDKVMVPTYALDEATRAYLRHEYLKTNLAGEFTVIGGNKKD